MKICYCILTATLLLSAVDARAAQAMWPARDIVNFTSESLTLRKGKDEVVGYVSPARIRAVLQVKEKIEQQAGVSAELVIFEGKEPNAFSTPSSKSGPLVAINLGMIELIGDDLDGYAAVLGHEYAHLTLGHRETRQGRDALQTAASTILGAFLGRAGVQFAGTLSNLATTAVATTFTRDEERDADKVGLGYTVAAGHDPQGGVRLWERMAARGSTSIPFLSTHPASSERVENMRQLAARHSSDTKVASVTTIPTQNEPSPKADTTSVQTQEETGSRTTSPYESDISGVIFRLLRGRGIVVWRIRAGAQTDLKINDIVAACKRVTFPGVYILADPSLCDGQFTVRRDGNLQFAYVNIDATSKPLEPPIATTSTENSEKKIGGEQGDLFAAQVAVAKYPNDPESWRSLGQLYEKLGEIGHAIRSYQKAVELDPRETRTLAILGGLYARTNQTNKVREVWEALMQIDTKAAETFFAAQFMPK